MPKLSHQLPADNVRDEASQAMSAIVFEGADIEETLANLDATANQLLADSARNLFN